MTTTQAPTVEGFYVSVQNNGRSGFLLGPYATHEHALKNVDRGKAAAHTVHDDAHWFAYGTARVEAQAGTLPVGRLNDLVGLWPCVFCDAGVTHVDHVRSPNVKIGYDYGSNG